MASDNLELPGLSEPFEENETTTLCELCNGIISHHTGIGSEITVTPEFKLSEEEIPTMLLILNGAQGGCRLCAVVWRVFRDGGTYQNFCSNNDTNALSLNDIAKLFVISYLHLERSKDISLGHYKLSYKITYEKTNWGGSGTLVLVLDTFEGSQDFHKASESHTDTNYLSEERWRKFCYSSIRMCQRTHEICNSAPISDKASRCLPTRLIDVKEDPPKLILSSSAEPASSYAVLSHCWGRAPILTLTTKNLEAFQQGLPISQLSKTFRDTVDVGKRLLRDFNVRYIWIDSLCIIQDSKSDWENEAPKMSQVYGNAFCCIAATSATDGSKGLFSPRNSMVEEVIRININRSRYPYLPSPVSITILNKDKWLQFIREAPLNQRGWVVQERALTKRALQFFDGEVMWKCQQRMASETFSAIKSGLKIPDDRLLFPQSLTANFNFREFWNQLLRMYSKTILTYPDDILMAIAGVARQFGEYLPTNNKAYLAGMWSFELERQLGWRTTSPGSKFDLDRRGSPSSNVAPSWSWASSTGRLISTAWKTSSYEDSVSSVPWYDWTPAEYKRHMITDLSQVQPPQFTIIDVGTTLSTKDPFGSVTSGFLQLRGQLKVGRHSFTLSRDNLATWNNKNLHYIQVLGRSYLSPVVFDRLQSDDELREIREGMLFVFPLHFKTIRNSRALILKPSSVRKSLVRVGCLLQIPNIIDVDSESDKLIGEEFYEEYHGNGEYTIRII
ncbi:hypothetical protein BCIN_07g01230 [Botrytis cinerea B05.10]|uniref:Heterokaryon incompatibility domain-containing protein n=1 Tax=Botryotinia fuckeliana (strain B05.10) TaxID=332648 RepID=A0A384JM97_BOTFB|nr:hypothetical protein BCIN_07g01230 [Botrytis cinerea B05.10]ATZ51497.1 hypothetical protein BCIN_07g01230 [Botrytis cinerea B05.10]